jgi:hypothetical protein
MCFMCGLLCTMSNSNSYLSKKNCVGAHPLNVPLVVRASIYILAASSNQKEHLAIWSSVGQRICSITKEKLDAALSDALQLKLEVLWGLWKNRQW